MTDDDALTPAEVAALARHGWKSDGSFTANGVLLLRFCSRTSTHVQTAAEWRAELKQMEGAMDDNEFHARVEGNKIVANVIRGYQRQLAEAQAEVARLQTDLDGAREAARDARAAEEAERAKRTSGEAVILAARQVVAGPYSGNVTKLAAALDAYDKALEGRA